MIGLTLSVLIQFNAVFMSTIHFRLLSLSIIGFILLFTLFYVAPEIFGLIFFATILSVIFCPTVIAVLLVYPLKNGLLIT